MLSLRYRETVPGPVFRDYSIRLEGGGSWNYGWVRQPSGVELSADVTSLRPKVGRDRAHLERIASLVTSGAVKVPEIKVYPLSEAAAAHKVSEGRHLRGKLVFRVR